MNKNDIRSMTKEELTESLVNMGEKKFRAAQIFSWLHKNQVESFDEMTNLPLALRKSCEERFSLGRVRVVQTLVSSLDGTRKYLFELEDGNVIESVWMRYKHGNSICISSQAGCRMGCDFCASTIGGLARSLTAGEMLSQVYQIAHSTGERVSNVVIMGSGEPMDNYDQVLKFIRLISHSEGMNLSQRNITVSTCGLVEKIYQFSDEGLQVTLALSLHAADDETRRKLMPIAKKYTIAQVLEACDAYFEKTGRRISYEYSLVAGVNDNEEEAKKLSKLLKGRNCHVNLIPVNPVKERTYQSTGQPQVALFKNVLEKNGINATIRREMGRDINGACGQLRRSFLLQK